MAKAKEKTNDLIELKRKSVEISARIHAGREKDLKAGMKIRKEIARLLTKETENKK
ncbi:MAG: hypothetical protein AAB656_02915 [Patescibacteria group bacterium]